MIRSVEEIVDISESKSTPDRMAYKYLIKQVDKMLRSRAVDQQYDAMFEVPAMVLFQPHFDRDFVAVKLARHYRKRGFKCDKEGFTIVLRWGRMDSDDSDTDSDEDSDSAGNSQLYKNSLNSIKQHSSDEEEEKLPPARKIVVESASLVKRVAAMKNPSSVKK